VLASSRKEELVNVDGLLLTGTSGAGKSTVAAEVYEQLVARRRGSALIDLDAIAKCDAGDDEGFFGSVIMAENLALLWPNYRHRGVSRLVLARAVPDEDELRRVRAAVPDVQLTVGLLTADAETLGARLAARDRGELAGRYVARAVDMQSRSTGVVGSCPTSRQTSSHAGSANLGDHRERVSGRMTLVEPEIDHLAREHAFSGVIGIDRNGELRTRAYGLADRAHGIANTVEHRFGIASGTKTLTALGVLAAVADGSIELDLPIRSMLGDELPSVDDRVTVRHLLNHRSGIGDYFDENADPDLLDYAMRVPVHTLDGATGYMAALDGYPQKFEPGTDFAYCNSGYVLLAILLERATGMAYSRVIADKVTGPAGMTRTEFLRMDTLPGDAAIGYLVADGLRTNVLHLPVVGFGDGGVFTTVADVHHLWSALVEGRLGDNVLAMMTTAPVADARYGMGMWLDEQPGRMTMEGMDAGVSFCSTRFPDGSIYSVLSNTSEGAWPIAKRLAAMLGDDA
jgi:CubicO group peptidase (beta-lactamase class C family)